MHQFAVVFIAHVIGQAGSIHVTLVALVAAIRFIIVMLQQMEFEVIFPGEAVRADVACVGFVTSV